MENFIAAPVQKVRTDWSVNDLCIKRLDLIRSWASGNKYYKLKQNIRFALDNGFKTIASKGGMFSNHLEALSCACRYFNLDCICIIRSYGDDPDNPTLQTLLAHDAQLLFMDPAAYDLFDENDSKKRFSNAFFIPEGGGNLLGIQGAGDLMNENGIPHATHIVIAGGTMTTAAGMINNASSEVKIIIVPAWKGCTTSYVQRILDEYELSANCEWEIWPDYHFGGFGKTNLELFEFMYDFTKQTTIPLDPVYTGKMMFAIKDKIKTGYFDTHDRILAIHTGGVQGIRGFVYRFPDRWKKYAELIDSI